MAGESSECGNTEGCASWLITAKGNIVSNVDVDDTPESNANGRIMVDRDRSASKVKAERNNTHGI
ncbi:MAG: hypothetical protein AAF317_15230 [Pseudomonadota bacterium]